MIKWFRRRTALAEDDGVALVWMAGSLVMLLAFSALAVDLAWIYLSASRLQNAADAAALAGVINIPAFPDRARSEAADAAAANGFAVGTGVALASTQLGDHSLEVTLRTSTPTYFLKALGIRQFQISRTSTAQYLKPVPMGSPASCFGIGSLGTAEGCSVSGEQNFWAAVNSRFTAREHGDPYLTQCDWGDRDLAACTDSIDDGSGSPWDTNASSLNPEYRPSGYYYAVEVPEGKTSIEVEIYDAGFSAGSLAGDADSLDHSLDGGPDMVYQLHDVDTTPLNPYDNPPLAECRKEIASPAPAYRNRWATLCTVPDPNPGIYVLNVRHRTGSSGGGNNGYGLNVIGKPAGSPAVRLYGINDISIFTNQPDATGNLTLAEVDPEHAGKVLELSFYDPGEDDQDAHMTVLMPDGSTADCTWVARNQDGQVTNSGGPGVCTIQTADKSLPTASKSLFNGQWVTATIDIPDWYTCSTDCWWSVRIDLNQPHDRTTWAARIIGNPVRLIPNR